MLVLSRKKGETIQIGEAITITVVDRDKNGDLKIGITAPPNVPIWRGEIAERMRAQSPGDPLPLRRSAA
ncbi:MAG: carbon storage regulator [Gemmataceae bacterium]|nr:carbon storage regulator [Gemmataceae bacterium]